MDGITKLTPSAEYCWRVRGLPPWKITAAAFVVALTKPLAQTYVSWFEVAGFAMYFVYALVNTAMLFDPLLVSQK